jgi:hypothetical protein
VEQPFLDRDELTHALLAIHDITLNVEAIRILLEEDAHGEAGEDEP